MLGAVLLALLLPDLAAAAVCELLPSAPAASRAAGGQPAGPAVRVAFDDDGACDEDNPAELEELVDCGADLEARLDEPLAITVLRQTEVRTTREQCNALLIDIWSRQACSAISRDCGKLLPGATPGPGPKLASSAGTGQASLAALRVMQAASRRLGRPEALRMPSSRDLLPPVPPPELIRR